MMSVPQKFSETIICNAVQQFLQIYYFKKVQAQANLISQVCLRSPPRYITTFPGSWALTVFVKVTWQHSNHIQRLLVTGFQLMKAIRKMPWLMDGVHGMMGVVKDSERSAGPAQSCHPCSTIFLILWPQLMQERQDQQQWRGVLST